MTTAPITALTIVRTFEGYEEVNQYGAIRLSCWVEGQEYHSHKFYDLTPRLTPYQALEFAAEKLLECIAA